MTVPWSPPLDAAAARWQTLARGMAQAAAPPHENAVGLGDGGLYKMFVPARQGGAAASVTAVVAVLEVLAAPCPRLAVLLAAALAGAAPLLRLGNARQKKQWLAPQAEHHALPPLLVGPHDAIAAAPAFTAAVAAQDWALHGQGHWLGAADATGAFVVFAAHPPERGAGQQISAFVVPRDTVGLTLEGTGFAAQSALTGRLDLNAQLAASLLLGPAGGAQAALEETVALRRIAAAAQSIGVSLAAYRLACHAAGEQGGSGAARPALKLAGCATALSAARIMLYQAARTVDAAEDAGLLSAMAMLSADECADLVLGASLQIASAAPSADPSQLQVLLRARQLQQVTAGAPEAQALLLSDAIVPHTRPPRGAESTMTRNSPARTGQPPGRIDEILDAAADAFTQQSYDATTLDYIGDAIGVTKGSIYYHYRSKADLFAAVYRRAMEMNIDTVTPIAEQPGVRAVDRLYRMAYAHSLQVMKHLSYQRLAVQGLEAHLMGRVNEEQRTRLNEVITLRDRYEDLFVQTIQQSIDAGELPRQNPRLAVKPLFGAINWTTMWYQPRVGETAADRERIAAHLATFVVSGLTQSHQPAPLGAATPVAATA